MAANVGRFDVPYLFVKGNHDDADMVEAVAANDNARVLDGTSEVAGIRFFGVADPTFTPGKGYQVEEFEELKVERSVGVADAVDRQALRPDVLWSTTAAWPPTPAATWPPSSRATCTASAPRSSTAPAP